MKKRIISLLVALGLFCSVTVFAGEFYDVSSESECYEAVLALSEAGILSGYEDSSFRPENPITRAEAAAVIVRAAELDHTTAKSSVYTDVADDFWGRSYIMLATDANILNGMGDGTFSPDSSVTYNQIIKMVVCMAGLEEQAIIDGGWPKGYVQTARDYDIIDWNTYVYSDTIGDKPASRGDVAQYVYNVRSLMKERELTVNGVKYSLGMSTSALGTPDETFASNYDFMWHVYETDSYNGFLAVGVKNNKVSALVACGNGFEYDGYQSGDVFLPTGELSNILFDTNDGNRVHGVALFEKGYFGSRVIDADKLFGESRLNFHLTNAFRVFHGLRPLRWSDAAAEAARLHSQDMADNSYFSHDSLSGIKFSARLTMQGIDWSACSENISCGSGFFESAGVTAYDAWVNSAGHRKNMLGDREYLGVGAGYNAEDQYGWYFTQDFYTD